MSGSVLLLIITERKLFVQSALCLTETIVSIISLFDGTPSMVTYIVPNWTPKTAPNHLLFVMLANIN